MTKPEPYRGSERELEDEKQYFMSDRTMLHRIEERLARIEMAVESLIQESDYIRTDMRELRTESRRNFLWTLSVILPMWVSIIVAVIVAILVK